jgi:paraquat-inducible protein A
MPNSNATAQVMSAIEAGLVGCKVCSRVNPEENHHCRVCGATLHSRIPDSINRCWALTITATLLLIPANVLPMMTIISLGQGEPDTIMSGIIALFQAELYPIGIIVFVASIMVPILKIIGLYILLGSIHLGMQNGFRSRTRIFRMIDFFGKWSMLDVFVVSLLVALVDIGDIAAVIPGIGTTAFCIMVILTMFAAHSFDTRLIWDCQETGSNERN